MRRTLVALFLATVLLWPSAWIEMLIIGFLHANVFPGLIAISYQTALALTLWLSLAGLLAGVAKGVAEVLFGGD